MKTKINWITPIYWASLAITVVVLAIYLMNMTLPYGTTTLLIVVIITMVLAFADYSKSYAIVKKMIEDRKEKAKGA